MGVQTLSCASCGAPITIPEGIENLTCTYCGASLEVKRGEGYVALKVAEEIGRTIEDTSEKTRSTIREGAELTQTELKRLQLTQELSSVQVRLTTLRSEIRSLEREKRTPQVESQLKELYAREGDLMRREKQLQSWLATGEVSTGEMPARESTTASQSATDVGLDRGVVGDKDWRTASALGVFLGWLGAHRFYTGHIIYGVIQFLTFGGFLIWWMIDLYMLATGRYRDSKGRLLQNPGGRFGESCLLSAVVSLVILLAGMIVVAIFVTGDAGEGSFSGVLMAVSLAAGAIAFAYLFFVGMKRKYE